MGPTQSRVKQIIDDIIYYSDMVRRFSQCLEDKHDVLSDAMSVVDEDIVIAELNRLASQSVNTARNNHAYQLLKAAYVEKHPESIVGEM